MKKSITIVIINLLLLPATILFGQSGGVAGIEEISLRRHLEVLASDSLEGRKSGEAGYNHATDYIVKQLEKQGIKRLPGMPGYLQEIELINTKSVKEETFINICDKDGNLLFRSDSILVVTSDSESFSVTDTLLYGGYGITDSRRGYDDYSNISVRDQALLIMSRSPWDAMKGAGKKSGIMNMSENVKIGSAAGRGSKLILYALDPGHELSDFYQVGIDKYIAETTTLKGAPQSPINIKLVIITRYAALKIMEAAGEDMLSLVAESNEKNISNARMLEKISVTVNYTNVQKELKASNVIGYIEGHKKNLKDGYVVYSAHLDHMGIDNDGAVFSGADDNASGSAALLEIAKAFQHRDSRPGRSIIFLWTAAEEIGLYGASRFVSDPPVPLTGIVANINLDMVGRTVTPADTSHFMGEKTSVTTDGEFILHYSAGKKEFLKSFSESATSRGLTLIEEADGPMFTRSDHVMFHQKGIPSYFLTSGLHADYHTTRDKIEMIDFQKVKRAAQLAFLAGYNISHVQIEKK